MRNSLIGTTRIELTDVRTGAREIHEKHNLVTNALQDIFKPSGLSNRPSRYFNEFIPYYATLLGGILCFDTEIEENPDHYYPPANAVLIGCASYDTQNNTKNTFRGGFNTTESEVNLTDRYVKYVYDFATSQANGTIASVCLTHKNGGFTSYGGKNTVYNTSYPLMQSFCEDTLQYVYPDRTGAKTSSRYSGMTVGTTEVIFLIDRKKDCAYYFKAADKSHIHITKRRTFLNSISILDNTYNTKPLIEEIELNELESELRIGYWGYNYDPSNDCLYICTAENYTTKPNDKVLVTEIKVDTWEIKQYEITNTSDKNLNTGGCWQFFVTGGYIFLKGSDSPYDVYKFQLDNPANAVKLTRTNVTEISGYPKLVINGRIYFENSSSQLLIANTHTDEIMPPECKSLFNSSYQTNVTPVRNEPLVYFADYGTYSTSGWHIMCNYLATINNLDTPVTKTADKTMKITYILQEQ